jgi:photosystem II stability/assembly factor-like uncharacterized protein
MKSILRMNVMLPHIIVIGLLATMALPAQLRDVVMIRPCSLGPTIVHDVLQQGDSIWMVGPQSSIGFMRDLASPVVWSCLPEQFDVHVVDLHRDTLFVAGTKGQLWYLADGTWKRRELPTSAAVTATVSDERRTMLLTDDNSVLVMTGLNDAITTLDAPQPDGQWRSIARHADTIVLVGQRGSLAMSTDAGSSWRSGPKPADTLQWNVAHRLADGRWLIGGDGARVAYVDPGLTTFLRIQRVFTMDPRRPPPNVARADAIDHIVQSNDGRLWIGGRTFASYLNGIEPTHGLYSALPDDPAWTKHAFISELRPEDAVPIIVDRCVGIIKDNSNEASMLAVVSCAWNDGGLTTIHACARDRHISTISGMHTPHRIVRDSLGGIKGIASQLFVGVAPESDSTFLVIANARWVTPFDRQTPAPSMLLRVTWSPTSTDCRYDTVYSFTEVRLTNLARVGGALLVGDDSCLIHRSTDEGRTWSTFRLSNGRLGTLAFAVTGRRVMTVLQGTRSTSDDEWSGTMPVFSDDEGATWRTVPLPPKADSTSLGFNEYKPRSDGSFLVSTTRFDKRTKDLSLELWILDHDGALQPGPPLPDGFVLVPGEVHNVIMPKEADDVLLVDMRMSDSSVGKHRAYWDGAKWTTRPMQQLVANGTSKRILPSASIAGFSYHPALSFLSVDRAQQFSLDDATTWSSLGVSDAFLPFGMTVYGVLHHPTGHIAVGRNGNIGYFPKQPSTGLPQVPAMPVAFQSDVLTIAPGDQQCVLTDALGRHIVIDLSEYGQQVLDLQTFGLAPGLYGAVIHHRAGIRSQAVLITR